MTAKTLTAAAGLMTVAAIAACAAVISNASPGRRAVGHAGNHVVRAIERGRGRSASMVVIDPYAAGSKLTKIEYHLHDGYSKRVIIPGGGFILAEDIAICGAKGEHYPDNGFTGTGLPCKPALHQVEVFYHQHTGDLAGRFWPHQYIEVTEQSHGSGRYLTVGHIDHGALLSVEYYWANGEHLTVNLRGDVLVDHIKLITGPGRLSAVTIRHPFRTSTQN